MIRMRLRPAAESAVRRGHPWIFAESVREQNREGDVGELAAVYDRQDRFMAVGLYDPHSPLRVRVLHCGKPETIGDAWWTRRLRRALELRRGMFDERTTGCRLINGESDGWPGLVLDQYGEVLVMKLYTAAWLCRVDEVSTWIRREANRERMVLRLSRNIEEAAGAMGLEDGRTLWGEVVQGPVVFLESGLRFEADVVRGQKTGFFLDQRGNRRLVEQWAGGRRVLNAFSFSGGFSLYAARGGAVSVTDLDISAHALESGRRNFRLNEEDPHVRACRHDTVKADAFEWLARAGGEGGERYGLVILDPPSLARRESERTRAIEAYGRLARSGAALLGRGGILVAASCSAHVQAEEFFETVTGALRRAGRRVRELRRTGHAPDHPASFEEARYLKCLHLECF